MRLKGVILSTVSAFALIVAHVSWGKSIEERAYAIEVEKSLQQCLDDSTSLEEKFNCNSSAIKKLLKWHQGTFRFLPWFRNVSSSKSIEK